MATSPRGQGLFKQQENELRVLVYHLVVRFIVYVMAMQLSGQGRQKGYVLVSSQHTGSTVDL